MSRSNGLAQRFEAGEIFRVRDLETVSGERIRVPAATGLTHLQFRRFAGCPICSLHLHSVARRHDEITASDIQEVVVFHSSAPALRKHVGELPFLGVIPDPGKTLYREVGVEKSLRAFLKWEAWPPIFRGLLHSLKSIIVDRKAIPPVIARGGRVGLPCDLLLDNEGRVIASKYGSHADDQWSVDELLERASAARTEPEERV